MTLTSPYMMTAKKSRANSRVGGGEEILDRPPGGPELASHIPVNSLWFE
jgi:hypothetical protein